MKTSKSDAQASMLALENAIPGSRAASKRQILASALNCFDEQGIDATRIETIKDRSGSSIGSIYHHFGNKDGLISALFFAALDDQLATSKQAYKAVSSPREAIKVMVHSYLSWVSQQPQLARFMLNARRQVADGPDKATLQERNKRRFGHLYKWVVQGIKQGQILMLPKEIYASLLIGPSENYCRAWLSGRVQDKPVSYADEFADAAWRVIATTP